jgi:hypothetical protein
MKVLDTLRSTASGTGTGSLSALRQALTRFGDQRDWFGVPACGATDVSAAKRSRWCRVEVAAPM